MIWLIAYFQDSLLFVVVIVAFRELLEQVKILLLEHVIAIEDLDGALYLVGLLRSLTALAFELRLPLAVAFRHG